MQNGRQLEVFFDSDCPLCAKEIRLLQRFDRRSRIQFTDIAASDFDASLYGLTYQDFMDEIQGRLKDGRWIVGVEVLRQLYSAVGLRWLVLPTRLPGISHFLEWCYRVFARNRLKWTGRCTDSCKV